MGVAVYFSLVTTNYQTKQRRRLRYVDDVVRPSTFRYNKEYAVTGYNSSREIFVNYIGGLPEKALAHLAGHPTTK